MRYKQLLKKLCHRRADGGSDRRADGGAAGGPTLAQQRLALLQDVSSRRRPANIDSNDVSDTEKDK